MFLCGPEETVAYHDLRHQLKGVLDNRMGCDAFLGEQIADLKIKTNKDLLTIEVAQAQQSDLIVVFLGQPGTISELTAFAMDEKINPRLLVFNDEKYKGKETFLNRGPLSLLNERQIVHFDPSGNTAAPDIVTHVDYAIAHAWFNAYNELKPFSSLRLAGQKLLFEDFLTLCVIHASHPVRWEHLTSLLPILKGKNGLQLQLRHLIDLGLVKKVGNRYLPTVNIQKLGLPTGIVSDVGKVRMSVLDKKLRSPEGVDDNRILL